MQKPQDIEAQMSPEQMLEELARLRSENAALKQDNASLAQKGDELRGQRDTLSRQIEVLSADNDSLSARNLEAAADISKLASELQKAHDEIDRLNELILVMKRELYGPKSERGGFNDAEEAAAEKEKPEKERSSKPRGKIDYSRFDQEVVDHTAPADKLPCPVCGTARKPIGYDIRWELKYIPGKMVAVQHRMWKYVCPQCSKAHAEGRDEDVALDVLRGEGPAMPLGNSHAGASLLALIFHRKYRLAQPLYRICGDLSEAYGIQDGRNTMARWVVSSWGKWFSQVYAVMKAELLGRDLVHIDETPVICIERSREARAENNKKKGPKPGKGESGTTKSYMWLFCSAECDVPIYLYKFGPGRCRSVPEGFLGAWRGTMVTDCYGVYTKMCASTPGMQRVACGVHIRRYLLNAATGAAKAKGKVYSAAVEGVNRINEIFSVEDGIEEEVEKAIAAGELEEAGRWDAVAERRGKLLKPRMDAFEAWARDRLDNYAGKGTKLEEALRYALGNWADFSRILEDGRFPLSNNRAESAVRPFAVGRRNWLFCSSKSGAEASAGIYSIVTTARANGLDDERYMEWLLTEMPKADAEGNLKERLADFLPWSDKVPASCRLGHREEVFADDPIVDVDPTAFDRD